MILESVGALITSQLFIIRITLDTEIGLIIVPLSYDTKSQGACSCLAIDGLIILLTLSCVFITAKIEPSGAFVTNLPIGTDKLLKP